MSTLILLTATGLGLAALYFLIASGLTLIFGLADVLNLAHGAFLSVGAYGTWWAAGHLPGAGPGGAGFFVAVAFGTALGGLTGAAVEYVLMRPLYASANRQILATVGLSLASVALLQAAWGSDPRPYPRPSWTRRVLHVTGAAIPADRLLLVGTALVVLTVVTVMLRRTRFGLVVRAGVQDRAMVAALGIDVSRAFLGVFALGGAAAALAGAVGGVYFGAIDPEQGSSLFIFAVIVVVIGGMGSITGSALAAVLVGLTQQFVDYYGAAGAGDMSVVALLAVVLLVRPRGIAGLLEGSTA